MSWVTRVEMMLVPGLSSSGITNGLSQTVPILMKNYIIFQLVLSVLTDIFGGLDFSAPIRPVLVSPSSLTNVENLQIKAIHNSNIVQDSNTSEMIFDIATTIAFLSQGTTLEQGTIIMTGTPPGIGYMRDPKVVLRHGDDMRVNIEGIGKIFFY